MYNLYVVVGNNVLNYGYVFGIVLGCYFNVCDFWVGFCDCREKSLCCEFGCEL